MGVSLTFEDLDVVSIGDWAVANLMRIIIIIKNDNNGPRDEQFKLLTRQQAFGGTPLFTTKDFMVCFYFVGWLLLMNSIHLEHEFQVLSLEYDTGRERLTR